MILGILLFTAMLVPKTVELYYNGAVIDYTTRVSLKSGYNEVYLSSVPEGATVISVKGNRDIVITGFNLADSTPYVPQNIKKLQSVYDSLKEVYEILSWAQGMVRGEKEMLRRLISSGYVDSALFNGKNLSSFIDTVKRKSLQLVKEEKRLERRLKAISNRLQALEDTIRIYKTSTLRIDALARTGGAYRLGVRLFTPHITYIPVYSLNALPDKNLVILNSTARIRNNLDITLKNVHINLLMQNFSYGGIVNIEPQKYYYDKPATPMVVSYEMELAAPSKRSNEASIKLPPKPDIKSYITGKKFSLPLKYTLKSKSVQSLTIYKDTLKATFVRKAYPRMYDGAWLYATIKNGKYPVYLRNVKMSIDGVYQGTWSSSVRGLVQENDTFSANFGKDLGIEVKRETVQDFEKSTWTGNKVKKYEFKITVRNNHMRKAHLILYDNIPLFHSDKYKLNKVQISPEGYNLDEKTGVIKWDREIPPKKVEMFKIYYEVKERE